LGPGERSVFCRVGLRITSLSTMIFDSLHAFVA
jgi:hypothetical protein